MRLSGPRTIRGQLIAALVVFELLVLAGFAGLLIREQHAELDSRINRRLEFQASQLAIQVAATIRGGTTDSAIRTLQELVSGMARFPTIDAVQITNMAGRTIVSSDPVMNGKLNLSPGEQTYLRYHYQPVIFSLDHTREVVAPVNMAGKSAALVWVYPNDSADRLELHSMMRLSLISGLMVVLGCTMLASLLARSITKPLAVLTRATEQIVRDPENMKGFPLAANGRNEAASLTLGFNSMVSSLADQRAGLNDTLSILDSMLANAPIGLFFLDRKLRFVRVNQFLAEMSRTNMNRYLGRSLEEAMPPAAATKLRPLVEQVFETGTAVRDAEFSGRLIWDTEHRLSWLVSVFPVRSGGAQSPVQAVRWVGAIVTDTTERRQSEEALRRTEKLAAAGRLAASIAHEINNPLEAVTNLLYLLRYNSSLDAEAMKYTEMAQHEVARVSDITQQTLRFYRQSTLPTRVKVSELLDSVLTLHQGRVHTLQVNVERRYRDQPELFCLAGEMRQVFANLVGNALDAMMPQGGRLSVCVRRSQTWQQPSEPGVRVTVADSGSGMSRATMERIFEPFFTTKEATGTGLGLWVSSEIIRKHRGSVRIRSRVGDGPGCGTVFMLFFPDNSDIVLESAGGPALETVSN